MLPIFRPVLSPIVSEGVTDIVHFRLQSEITMCQLSTENNSSYESYRALRQTNMLTLTRNVQKRISSKRPRV